MCGMGGEIVDKISQRVEQGSSQWMHLYYWVNNNDFDVIFANYINNNLEFRTMKAKSEVFIGELSSLPKDIKMAMKIE